MIVNQFSKSKIIVVLGPTASGKSDLAVKIAQKFNGEIISADSRQVYKGLDIGSGKIAKKEMRGIPHYLLDIANPKKVFTASQYQKLAQKAIKEILKKDKTPIICGGTGLYIDSIIYNTKFPEAPPQPKLRKEFEKLSTAELFKKLWDIDLRRAKNIDKNNRRRLIRALEIIMTTGKPVSFLQKKYPYDCLLIGIKKSPEELKTLIKKRLIKRLRQGMVNEVKNLHEKQKLSWKRLDDLGLEYRYLSRYLRGLISKKEMMEAIEKESYKYAKRQKTWFKRNTDINWIVKTEEAFKLANDFFKNH